MQFSGHSLMLARSRAGLMAIAQFAPTIGPDGLAMGCSHANKL